ncbi:zinc finger protein 316-like [Pollicipes pollicipes]|uniref:zinc finger protein 316-like n=1 Tax=Pollicipes pollicipes TaxID=41117 RepID=UPI0018853036|nr:zinc finger protein 316-like [Pollicipes pollicipes]
MESTGQMTSPAGQMTSSINQMTSPAAQSVSEVGYGALPVDHDAYSLLLSPGAEIGTFLLPEGGGAVMAPMARVVPVGVLKAGTVETFSAVDDSAGEPCVQQLGPAGESHCLVCNGPPPSEPYSLFDGSLYTTTSRSTVLATLEQAVEAALDPLQAHSHVICSNCYDLADRLDQLQEELRQARDAVRRLFWHTAGLYHAAAAASSDEVKVERRRSQRAATQHEPGHYRSLADGRTTSPPAEVKPQPTEVKLQPTEAGALCNELDIDIHVEKTAKKREKREGRLLCRYCGKTFQRPARLQQHEASHTVQTVNQCHICSKIFSQKYYLREHIKQVHERRSLHRCDTCGKVFMRRLHLDDHVRTHSGDRPYTCEVCGRGFSQRGNLRAHALVHTGQFPYQCDTCGKRLRTRQAFEAHQRKHNDDRRFGCDLCSASFLLKRSLERHLRKHTGARPFKCNHCDRAFRDRGDLRCHEVIHSAQRAHVCPLCGLGFTRRYKMQKHLRTKHEQSEEQVQELCLLQQTAHQMLSQQDKLDASLGAAPAGPSEPAAGPDGARPAIDRAERQPRSRRLTPAALGETTTARCT